MKMTTITFFRTILLLSEAIIYLSLKEPAELAIAYLLVPFVVAPITAVVATSTATGDRRWQRFKALLPIVSFNMIESMLSLYGFRWTFVTIAL